MPPPKRAAIRIASDQMRTVAVSGILVGDDGGERVERDHARDRRRGLDGVVAGAGRAEAQADLARRHGREADGDREPELALPDEREGVVEVCRGAGGDMARVADEPPERRR